MMDAVESDDSEIVKILQQYGANCTNVNTGSPLHVACRKGNYKIVQILTNAGADVNIRDSYGKQPLYYAIVGKHVSIVKFLLEKVDNLSKDQNLYGVTISGFFENNFDEEALKILKLLLDHKIIQCTESLFIYALSIGHLTLLTFLINEGFDVNSRFQVDDGYNGLTPLCAACKIGNYEVVELLVNFGTDVNSADRDLHRPLYYAITRKRDNIFKLLLEKGANLGKCLNADTISQYFEGKFDEQAMNIVKLILEQKLTDPKDFFRNAVTEGNVPLLKFLINEVFTEDPRPEAASDAGWSPLCTACEKGHHEIAEILINFGCDVNAWYKKHSTPLYCAVDQNHADIVKLLLKSGASADKNPKVLRYFKDKKSLDIVLLLLDHKWVRMESLLRHAVMTNNVILLKFVIEQGVNLNSVIERDTEYDYFYSDGLSPLHVACEKGYYEIAEVLVNSGADVNRSDEDSRQPLHLAIEGSYINIVKLLLGKGANVDKDREIVSYFGYNFGYANLKKTTFLDIVKLLLDHKTVQLQDLVGDIVKYGNPSLLNLCIEKGLDVNSRFKSGDRNAGLTPLCLACKKATTTAIETLLKFGADINGVDEQGNTALYYCENQENLTFLLSRGIDTEIKNHAKKTVREVIEQEEEAGFWLIEYYDDNMEEISRMKNIVLNNYCLNLYDVMTMNQNELSRYVNNANLIAFFSDTDFDEEFQIFGEILLKKFWSAKYRKKLMDRASRNLENLTGLKIVELHFMIFKYLSNGEIKRSLLTDDDSDSDSDSDSYSDSDSEANNMRS